MSIVYSPGGPRTWALRLLGDGKLRYGHIWTIDFVASPIGSPIGSPI